MSEQERKLNKSTRKFKETRTDNEKLIEIQTISLKLNLSLRYLKTFGYGGSIGNLFRKAHANYEPNLQRKYIIYPGKPIYMLEIVCFSNKTHIIYIQYMIYCILYIISI